MQNLIRLFSFLIFSISLNTTSFAGNHDVSRGFADIIEPLRPAVVSIYTVILPKQKDPSPRMQELPFPKGHPFEQFNEFFKGQGGEFEGNFSSRKAVALGSGFIIDASGYIVTNHHVIKDADEINVKLTDKREFAAKVIGSDESTDLALLKIKADGPLPFVKFGDSSKARAGDWVIAIGNPHGFGSSISTGVISSEARDIGDSRFRLIDNFIQTDAAINPGNSGGPLFNIDGEVIGVNTVILHAGNGGSIGIGFATPSNTAEKITTQLRETGKITRGMLKIRIQEISSDIAESLGMKEPYGALVVDVEKGGPGDKAGIKTGDIITNYNGTKVDDSSKLPRLVAETPVNTNVTIEIIRNGKAQTLNTKLVATEEKDPKKPTIAAGQFEKHGTIFSNIDADTKKQFAIEGDIEGVIVTDIKRDSKWAMKGLLKGDIIKSANQQAIKNVKDLEKIYHNSKKAKKKNILFLVTRQTNTIFLAMPIED